MEHDYKLNSDDSRYVGFALGGIQFEYDENKNQNDRIEYFDEQESREEDRFDIIGDFKEVEVIRIISARYATSFERGIYYGKY